MATRSSDKKQVSNDKTQKARKGDTTRTSNAGRKLASGGSTNTNNQGRPKGV